MKFTVASVAAAIAASTFVPSNARVHSNAGSLFGIAKRSSGTFLNIEVVQQISDGALSLQSITSVPRGGADEEVDGEGAEEVKLYLPGLLEATVSGKWVSSLFMFAVSV